jgi:hypothetical protein
MPCQSPTLEVYDSVAKRRPYHRLTSPLRQLDHNQALLRPAAYGSAYHYGDVRPDQGFWTLR